MTNTEAINGYIAVIAQHGNPAMDVGNWSDFVNRVQAACKDVERLDWLLKHQCTVEPTNAHGAVLHVFTGPRHGPLYGRKAIDAGMARIH